MEMCYDGALVMPSSYAVMDEEEMTYVEGGLCKKYSGATGWAVASILTSTGASFQAIGGWLSKTIFTGCLAGGPIAWIIGAVSSLIVGGSSAWIGGVMASAGKDAFWT
ncbi:MAG: hypothetical protein IIT65_01550, partial [Lachnospiraceae bacterium]|nr:hypothetical protein [Lachnospiraceae bacterium]